MRRKKSKGGDKIALVVTAPSINRRLLGLPPLHLQQALADALEVQLQSAPPDNVWCRRGLVKFEVFFGIQWHKTLVLTIRVRGSVTRL